MIYYMLIKVENEVGKKQFKSRINAFQMSGNCMKCSWLLNDLLHADKVENEVGKKQFKSRNKCFSNVW